MDKPPSVDKTFVTEEELLLDAYRLGVEVFNSGFRPSFIVGFWRGGSSVGIAVQECLQHLGVATDHISLRTSYRGMQRYQRMVDEAASEIRVHGTQYLLETMNAEDGLLIVDDVYSTGLNVKAVIDRLAAEPAARRADRGPVVQAGTQPHRACTGLLPARDRQVARASLRAERPEPRRDSSPEALPGSPDRSTPGGVTRHEMPAWGDSNDPPRPAAA